VPISIRKAPSYTALATPEFLALVEAAQPKFTAMQAAAEKQWQIKSWDEWGFQQEAGILRFTNKDGSSLRATAQVIGTYDLRGKTWEWAWGNPCPTNPELRKDIELVKNFGVARGLLPLTTLFFRATFDEARALVALASQIAQPHGVYTAHTGLSCVAIAFRDPVLTHGNAAPPAPGASSAAPPAPGASSAAPPAPGASSAPPSCTSPPNASPQDVAPPVEGKTDEVQKP